jgi:hypothetical protein
VLYLPGELGVQDGADALDRGGALHQVL